MQTFFVDAPFGGRCQLSAEDSHHALKALRLREGEAIAIAYEGRKYAATLKVEGNSAFAIPGEQLPSPEASLRITLYQGLPKGDKMDFIVQKCTELGVHRIVPCQMARCVARWEGGEKKLARWQRIAREAAVQSGRALVPEVADCLPGKDIAVALQGHQLALLAWEESRQPLGGMLKGITDVALVIGPEGGVSQGEADSWGASPFSLGPRILRTETAGLAGVCRLLCQSGDMG